MKSKGAKNMVYKVKTISNLYSSNYILLATGSVRDGGGGIQSISILNPLLVTGAKFNEKVF